MEVCYSKLSVLLTIHSLLTLSLVSCNLNTTIPTGRPTAITTLIPSRSTNLQCCETTDYTNNNQWKTCNSAGGETSGK